jgi:membrane associated rhomboid family serine protease
MASDYYRYLTLIVLITLCAAVFAGQQSRDNSLPDRWGAKPARLVESARHIRAGTVDRSDLQRLSTLITHQFLHGDISHIAYNMVFLWVFGTLICELLGQWTMLAAYLVCGVVGGITHALMVPGSEGLIGASGAISGLEGLYIGLALRWPLPNVRVWPLAHPVPPMQMVAFAVLGFAGDLVLFQMKRDNIAHGAHMGGLLTGLMIGGILTTVYPTPSRWNASARR